jgi:hypothetical protein
MNPEGMNKQELADIYEQPCRKTWEEVHRAMEEVRAAAAQADGEAD